MRIQDALAPSDGRARQNAIAEWFREASVLVAVFPLIDQLVRKDAVDWKLVVGSLVTALILFVVG